MTGFQRCIAIIVIALVSPKVTAQTAQDPTWKRAYLLSRAGNAYNQGRLEEAAQLFQAVVRLKPTDEVALRHLGAIYSKQGQYDTAYHHLAVAASAHPKNFSVRFDLAVALMKAGLLLRALNHFKACTDLEPEAIDAWINLGIVRGKLGKLDASIAALRTAVTLNPASSYAHKLLGAALIHKASFTSALRHLTLAVRTMADDGALWLSIGHVHNRLGNDARALEAYEKSVTLSPKQAQGYLFMGNVLDRLGRIKEAQEAYEQAIAITPRAALPYVHLGNIYLRRKMRDKAREYFLKALAFEPRYVWALLQLGFLFLEQGDHNKAERFLTKAFEQEPNNVDVGIALGDIYRLRNELKQAEKHYRHVLTRRPKNLGAQLKLAETLQQRGRLQNALKLFQRASVEHPKSAWALILMGDCERQLKLHKRASLHYQQALTLDPRSTWATRQLGYVAYDLEDDPRAVKLLKQSAGAFPNLSDIPLILGHLATRAGNTHKAYDYYRKAHVMDLKNPGPLFFLAEAHRSAGRFKEAAQGYHAVLDHDPGYTDAWIRLGDTHVAWADKNTEASKRKEHLGIAINAYEKAIGLAPASPWPKRQLGFLLYRTQNLKRSAIILTAIMDRFPADADIPLTLGHIQAQGNHHGVALRFYQIAANRSPNDLRPAVFTGATLRRLGKLPDAIEQLQRATQIDAASSWAWLELGIAQFDQRNMEEAAQSAERSVALNAQSAEAWLFVGRLRQLTRNHHGAILAFEHALRIAPDHPRGHLAMASALLARGEPKDLAAAALAIDVALKSLQSEGFTHLVAGHIAARLDHHMRRGRRVVLDPKLKTTSSYGEQATFHFNRAIDLSEDKNHTTLSVARGFFAMGDLSRAVDLVTPLGNEESCPRNPWEIAWRAVGTEARAQAALRAAHPLEALLLTEQQVSSRAQLLLGDAAMRSDKAATAQHAYTCAVALDPGNAMGHLRLGLSYETEGLMQLAQEHYIVAQLLEPHAALPQSSLDRLHKEAGYPLMENIRLSGAVALSSAVVPPEILARQAKTLGFSSPVQQRTLLQIPRTFSVGTTGVYEDHKRRRRFELSYDFAASSNAFINDSLVFESNQGHTATLRNIGRILKPNLRQAELRYDAAISFGYAQSNTRGALRTYLDFGTRLQEMQAGSVELRLGLGRADFKKRNAIALTDKSTNHMHLQLTARPTILRHRINFSTTLTLDGYWLFPSGRTIWESSWVSDLVARFHRFTTGIDMRLGLTADKQQPESAPRATRFSYGLGASGQYRWPNRGHAKVRFGLQGVPGSAFDSVKVGFQGGWRLWPTQIAATHTGLVIQGAYDVLYNYGLGQTDHLLMVQLSIGR